MANETFTATQTTVATPGFDADLDNVIDPGERVTTTVAITNNSTNTAATDVQFNETLQGMTLVDQGNDGNPVNDINASPIAFNDSYSTAGNVTFNSPVGVLANDAEPLGPEGLLLNAGTAIQNTGVSFATAQGGTATINPDGTFTYVSAVGFEGVDTFTYTLRDTGLDGVAGNADDLADTGTVSITVGPSVWFIDNTAQAGGNGTQAHPFNSIAAFNAAQGTLNGPDTGDFIYLRQGTGTYSEADGINLANGQTLIGAGQDLVVNGVTIETHTAAPTIEVTGAGGEGVLLAQNNTLKGFNISSTVASADGIEDGGGSVGSLTISSVSISGTGQAVDIDQGGNLNVTLDSLSSSGSSEQGVQLAAGGAALTGTFTATAGSISGSTGAAFLVGDGAGTAGTGGTIAVTFGGSISSTGAVRTVDIEDRVAGAGSITLSGNLSHASGNGTAVFLDDNAAGTITFSGATKTLNSGTATAVSLTDNTGTTINFTGGGLDIDTTSGSGFLATGGGTVTVQGAGNSITSTTGTALNVASTTIGAADMTFQSISAGTAVGSAGVGISLDNTGTAGGLHVTGTGTAGSGGTIQHKTGADGSTTGGIGIYLNNTSEVTLNNMNLHDFDNLGIFGTSVNGIKLTNSTIGGTIGTSTGSNDAAIAFGTTGGTNGFASGSSSLIDNVDISGSIEHNFEVYQQSNTFNLTIQNSNIHDNNALTGSDGFLIETTGTAHGIVKVDNTTFDDNRSQAVQANALGTSFLELTLNNNDVLTSTQGNEGFVLQNGGSGDLTVAVTNNTFTGVNGTNVLVGNVAGNATSQAELNATVSNNLMTLDGPAVNRTLIAFFSSTVGQVSTSKVVIDGNTINTIADPVNGLAEPLFVSTPDLNTDPLVYVQVSNNVVNIDDNNQLALRGIAVQSTQNTSTMHADVRGNDVNYLDGAPAGVNGIRVREVAPATLDLEPGVGGATAAQVLANNNPLSTTEVLGTVTVSANNNTVLLPSTPTTPSLPSFLQAASGGVDAAPPANDPPAGSGGQTPASPTNVNVGEHHLTQSELDSVVNAAIARWELSGLSSAQLAALHAMSFGVADMAGLSLGAFTPGHITLDNDAAGRGWYVDATPLDDAEFGTVYSLTRMQTDPTGAPAGHYDLLTTVMHEMGHALGLADHYELTARDDLMYGWLYLGERRLPGQGEADAAVTGAITSEAFFAAPIDIGTLPAGKTVTLQWQATIDPQNNGFIVNPVNTGTVSASNAVGFPDQNTNTVSTTLDSLTLGGTVWNDNGAGGAIAANGIKDGTEPGIDSVLVALFADNGTTPGVWDASDTQLASQVTVGGGNYSFVGLAPGDYIVRIEPANFNLGGPLHNFLSSVGQPDPDDGDPDIDNDDNGAPMGVLGAGGFVVSLPITLAYNTEPTAGTGNDTNTTLDFGFVNNPPPAIAGLAGDTTTYVEEGAVVLLDVGGNAVVTDNQANFNGGNLTVSITGNKVAGEDVLAISTASGVGLSDGTNVGSVVSVGVVPIGTVTSNGTNGNDLVVTFNTNATPANVSALIHALAYSNNNAEDPSTLQRMIAVSVDDGLGGVGSADVFVNVVDVNDEPTLFATGNNPTFTEGGPAADLFSAVTASTVETGQSFTSLTLTVDNVTDGANEILVFDGSDVALTNGNTVVTSINNLSVHVSLVGTTATVTFAGAALSAPELQAVVDGFAYRNTSMTPTDADRVIIITELVDSGPGGAPDDNTAALGIVSTVNVNPAIKFAQHHSITDFNPDSPDVLWERVDGTLMDQHMNGPNIASFGIGGSVGPEWHVVGTGDYNGDHAADLFFRRDDGVLRLLEFGNNQVQHDTIVGQVGNEWQVLGSSDFNGDGRDDLLWQRSDGRLMIFDMNGPVITASPIIGQIGAEWELQGTGDYNGDGTGDMLWRRGDGTVLLFEIGNNQVQKATIVGVVGNEWHVAGSGDFNGDHRTDVLWERNDGTLRIDDMNGPSIMSTTIFGQIGSEWTLQGTADYDGNGTADVVWQRTSDGALHFYQMANNQVQQATTYGQVGLEWHLL